MNPVFSVNPTQTENENASDKLRKEIKKLKEEVSNISDENIKKDINKFICCLDKLELEDKYLEILKQKDQSKLVIKLIDGEEKRIKKLEKKKNILSIFKDLFSSLWIMFTLPFRLIFRNLGIS